MLLAASTTRTPAAAAPTAAAAAHDDDEDEDDNGDGDGELEAATIEVSACAQGLKRAEKELENMRKAHGDRHGGDVAKAQSALDGVTAKRLKVEKELAKLRRDETAAQAKLAAVNVDDGGVGAQEATVSELKAKKRRALEHVAALVRKADGNSKE